MLEKLLGSHPAAFEPRIVGQRLPRVDGRAKVTGAAQFTAEHHPDGLVHGVVVGSAIARGRVVSVDTAAIEALPGVLAAGSRTTASVGAAVLDAGRKLIDDLKSLAHHAKDVPLAGVAVDELLALDGQFGLRVSRRAHSPRFVDARALDIQ